MGKKTDIKVCRYIGCKHADKHISQEEFKVVGTMYYHPDCYKAKQTNEWKDEQTKKDLQYIKNQWVLHISQTVVYSQLFRCLNEFIARGIPSDYLVFVFDYYLDKPEIKEAYQKRQYAKNGIKKATEFTAVDDNNAPQFSIGQKPQGFKSILGGKK